jgi:opacity protein-like surface antigen
MSGVNQSEVPAGTTTLKDQSSFITTISPKVGVNLARTFDTSGNLSVLSLTYAPDIVVYHELPSENYDAHRLLLAVRGKDDAFSYSLDNTLVYVEASTLAPTYPGNLLNAWATINDWQRREQLNDRSKVSLQYDWDKWFIRPGASLAYYGMMTQIKDVEGYQNYPTRYDVNGGADVGYKFCTNMAATLGYRYGSQGQQQFSFSPYSSPSDYQRVLLGVEGKPLSWLSIQMLGGPDFRSYAGDTATHITPVNDLHMTTYYGESTIAATLTPDDMLSFKYKQFQFVSSCGKVPYFDSSYALCYDRKITDRLSVEVGPRLLEADYNSGNLSSSSSKRDDLDYILSVGLHYVFSANIAADLSYSASLGRNAEANIANSQTRDFDAQDVSLGVQFKY